MIFTILSLLAIILAILERYFFLKRKDIWDRHKLLLAACFIFVLLLISYFVTDTLLGLVNILVLSLSFSLLSFLKQLKNNEKNRMLAYIVGFPLITLLMISSIRNSLINFRFLYILILILNVISRYPNNEENNKKVTISLIAGGIISLGIIFALSKGPKADYILLSRQEIVAKDYVEEKYGDSDSYVYLTWTDINLRGKDIEIRAFGTNNISLQMIYNKGEIIKETLTNQEN